MDLKQEGTEITRMQDAFQFDFTEEQITEIEIKLATIEERIVMQMKNAIMGYVSDKMEHERAKKKAKPYYRRGRWE